MNAADDRTAFTSPPRMINRANPWWPCGDS